MTEDFLTVDLSGDFCNFLIVSALSQDTFERFLGEEDRHDPFSKGELPSLCTVPSSRHSNASGKDVKNSVAVFASKSFTGEPQTQSDFMSSPIRTILCVRYLTCCCWTVIEVEVEAAVRGLFLFVSVILIDSLTLVDGFVRLLLSKGSIVKALPRVSLFRENVVYFLT